MSDNWVYSIAIDEGGTKWIGTHGGLARFDDSNWTVYNTSNSGLPDNWIYSIAIDVSGTKWIGTFGGLARFDGSNWTVYNTSNSGLPGNIVPSIAIDVSGTKWIGTSSGGLALYTGDGGSPFPLISLSSSSLNFGALTLGESTQQTVDVTNSGSADLVINSTDISGPNSSDFSIISGSGFGTLTPSNSRTMTFQFSPQSEGSKIAYLIITSNAVSSPDTVILNGIGVSAEMLVSPLSINFGNVKVGNNKTDSVSIKNIGTAELSVGSISLSGTNPGNFMVDTGSFTLAPGDSQFLNVSFAPDTVGSFSASLNIFCNGGNESVSLMGTGISPGIQLSVSSINFGNCLVNDTAVDSLFITNTGNAELNVGPVTISGSNPSNFVYVTTAYALAPGNSQSIGVSFTPNARGNFTAVLNIGSTAGNRSASLSGTGIAPLVSLSTFSINFAGVQLGESKTVGIILSNTGDAPLTIINTELSGTNANDFTLESGEGTRELVPLDSFEISLRFSPQTEGNKTASLVISNNASSSPDLVNLSGSGIVISVQVEQDTTATAGNDLNITVTPSQNFQPTIRRLYYRQAGDNQWNYIELEQTGTTLEFIIPPDSVTYRGVEYYVYLSDGENVVTYPENDPQNNPAAIQVKIDQQQNPLSFSPLIYKMISVPIELDNPEIFNVLGDDYGDYNIKYWRLLRWQEGDSSYYVEYPNIEVSFIPGNAFWLITRQGKSFDIENGWSINSSQPYYYTLQPGWNQVANPFAFPVSVDSINITENIEPPVYYNGREYQYDVTVLYPWEGYFVYNNSSQPVSISIPSIKAEGGGLAKSANRLTINTDSEYLLQLSAEMIDTRLIDTQNYIGLLNNATEEHDSLDFSEAPPIGEYLQLSIIQEEERFAGNFKPISQNGQQWELEVSSSELIQKPIQIDLIETGIMPEGFELFILDKDYNCPIQIYNKNFNVHLNKEFPVRRFKILIGTDEYAEQHNENIPLIPIEYCLEQNYPNPFNSETTIQYQLSRRSKVVIEVFNIVGHKVRTLVKETKNTGQHSVIWDGLNDSMMPVTSGIYLYRLNAEKFVHSKKLILVR